MSVPPFAWSYNRLEAAARDRPLAFETQGTVIMRGEGGAGIAVSVVVDGSRIRLVSGDELIGDWESATLGISALSEGFAVRAEGEEFILKTENDAGLAEGLGMAATSPRLARQVAKSHAPEEREPEPDVEAPRSRVGAIVFAVGGVLVLAGGTVLRSMPTVSVSGEESLSPGGSGQFWVAFVVGGLLMAAVAYILAIGTKWARIAAFAALAVVIGIFAMAAQTASISSNQLPAYGFIAGGIVVGVAVVFSGSLND